MAVCLPKIPFEHGGAEILAESLVDAIRDRGHDADLLTIPFKWYPNAELLKGALSWRLLDLEEANGRPVDVVIATKFPAYLVRHPRKVLWLFHQFRQAYDLHRTDLAQFGDDPEGAAMRGAIREMDERAFGEARGLFAISGNVAGRARRYNGAEVKVLRPPPQELDLRWLADDGYLLSVGRLDRAKRIDLFLRGLAEVSDGQGIIVGDGPDRARLQGISADLGLVGRVTFTGRVERDELSRLYGRCRGVYYAPVDEDYGFVPLEAHLAGKPVVTTTDAGGPLDVVLHEVTGLVTEPTPGALAAALGRLHGDPGFARQLGAAGAAAATTSDWPTIVETLLEAAGV